MDKPPDAAKTGIEVVRSATASASPAVDNRRRLVMKQPPWVTGLVLRVEKKPGSPLLAGTHAPTKGMKYSYRKRNSSVFLPDGTARSVDFGRSAGIVTAPPCAATPAAHRRALRSRRTAHPEGVISEMIRRMPRLLPRLAGPALLLCSAAAIAAVPVHGSAPQPAPETPWIDSETFASILVPSIERHGDVLLAGTSLPAVPVAGVDRAAVALEDEIREANDLPPRFAIPNAVK